VFPRRAEGALSPAENALSTVQHPFRRLRARWGLFGGGRFAATNDTQQGGDDMAENVTGLEPAETESNQPDSGPDAQQDGDFQGNY